METASNQACFECAVCGASAKGFHFGAFTCEGCKSFFGRTSLRKERPLMCRAGGSCDVQGENRTACKACRYEKCLRAGMSPMNSRFGRRSKYFKVSAALSVSRFSSQRDDQPLTPSSCPSTSDAPSTVLSPPSALLPHQSLSSIFPPAPVYQMLVYRNLLQHIFALPKLP
ncbi:unnamed protein product, partial [Mesorhabditis spiculigera]